MVTLNLSENKSFYIKVFESWNLRFSVIFQKNIGFKSFKQCHKENGLTFFFSILRSIHGNLINLTYHISSFSLLLELPNSRIVVVDDHTQQILQFVFFLFFSEDITKKNTNSNNCHKKSRECTKSILKMMNGIFLLFLSFDIFNGIFREIFFSILVLHKFISIILQKLDRFLA